MFAEQNIEFYFRQFYERSGGISLYPQGRGTGLGDLDAALSVSSKKGTGKRGAPDFIGVFPADERTILVVECKADAAFHKSQKLVAGGAYIGNDKIKGRAVADYACDGALHYGKILSPHYNVVALGVSGDGRGKIAATDYYYQIRGGQNFVLMDTDGADMLPPSDILRAVKRQKRVVRYRAGELVTIAHSSYRVLSELGVSPADRAFFIGMLLVALDDKEFNGILSREHDLAYILSEMSNCVCERFDRDNGAFVRRKTAAFCADMQKSVGGDKARKESLTTLARNIKRRKDDTGATSENDDLGAFFTSFLTKAPGSQRDQQELGIVLTPHHITEIFPMLAPVNGDKDSVFADSCCGTGGFLIAALKSLEEANPNPKRTGFVNKNLLGVEQDPKMYWLACLNMILKGGDASNIILGDSFAEETREKMRAGIRPNIAFLNPPYTMRSADGQLNYNKHELQFVRNACDIVRPGGKVVALMPAKSVASSDQQVNLIKERLMKDNTLEGVFKMSSVTFEGVVNVETIIVVCTAGKPHDKNREVYFGDWTDDGMHFVRKMGAVDKFGAHDSKVKSFVGNFHARKETERESILAAVNAEDEWLYQAQLPKHVLRKLWKEYPCETNVARHILNYFAAQARLGDAFAMTDALRDCAKTAAPPAPEYWRECSLEEVLELSKGKRFSENQANIQFKEYPERGYLPYVSSSDIEEKQGLNGYISASLVGEPTHNGAYMTLNYGGGQLNCFYREGPAYCTDSLNVAKLPGKTPMNVYIAAYLKEMIVQYKPCFSYNLAPSLTRIRPLKIPLPMTADGKPDWSYLDRYARRAFYAKFGRANSRFPSA